MKKCLVDAGPLIALFDKSDDYHITMMNFFSGFKGRLITSWAVITEVLHMLDFNVNVQLDFLEWICRDAFEIPELDKADINRMKELCSKYSDVPMDFADATLMILSETYNIREIITIDSDFHIYRNIRNQMLTNIFRDT